MGGGIVIHLISGLLRSRGENIPWKLSVFFNGMRVRDERFAELFNEKLSQPAVMVYGRKDEFYEYGQKQIDMYEDPVVLEHEEGHKFPAAQPHAKQIYEEVTKMILQHCGLN